MDVNGSYRLQKGVMNLGHVHRNLHLNVAKTITKQNRINQKHECE